jgi:small subunit ribosomal protein S18
MDQDRRPRRDDEGAEEELDERGRSIVRRAHVCQFCADKNKSMDYKNLELLRTLVSDRGKIKPRRQTGTCARHQRAVAIAIKRARHMALVQFTGSMPR